MDMKYDSSVMHKLVDATERRMVEAFNSMLRIESAASSVNSSDWDDAKQKEFAATISDIKDSLFQAVQALKTYLDHLQVKMNEFENRS